MAVMVIVRFEGDVDLLKHAYDEAHRRIMASGGATGELRHHCAIGEGTLYIIGVWESEAHLQRRFQNKNFKDSLADAGFPSFDTADVTVLQLHATEPPL